MFLAPLRDALVACDAITLAPPASPEAIAAFEARLKVTLPEGYRSFLLEVGDGIHVDGEPWLYSIEATLQDLGRGDASLRFWYSEEDAAKLRAALASRGPGVTVMDSPAFMALQKRTSCNEGCITVASNGGNDFTAIVTTGPLRGQMWRTGEIDLPEVLDLYGVPGDFTTQLDFLAWLPPWARTMLGVELPAAPFRS